MSASTESHAAPPTTLEPLKTGDWVEVKSREEILATLDEQGKLEGMPFMPSMLGHCGRRFRVFRRAHKTCDTVNLTGGRRVKDAVHLEDSRCDGAAYGGCEAACLIFWKTAWLRQVDGPGPHGGDELVTLRRSAQDGRTLGEERPDGVRDFAAGGDELLRHTRAPGSSDDDPTYVCQATALPAATELLPWWDVRQYAEDVASGNEKVATLLRGAAYVGFFSVLELATRLRGRRKLIGLYDRFQALRGGVPFPRKQGTVPDGTKTPTASLKLEPGEWVRVKSYAEILSTLDWRNKNRGLYFDAEEVPYCGGTYQVRSRVSKIIDERTGKLIPIGGSTVILENVWCKGHYSDRRMYCPRAIYPFWREAWLERVETPAG